MSFRAKRNTWLLFCEGGNPGVSLIREGNSLTYYMANPIQINLVAGVIIKKDGKYLLVQEKLPKAYGLWNFPAGKVEEGDIIAHTAIKEAKEETGYDVKLLRHVGVFNSPEKICPCKHAYEAEIIGGELKFPEDEIMDAKWFSYDEIKKMKDKLRGGWVLEAIDLIK